MGYTFWQGIKSLRSVAYFKQAMDAGGTKSLQEKMKENPRFRDKLILSGVICASTVALFGRSLYRKAKSAWGKHQKKKQERKEKLLASDFDEEGHTLSTPVQSSAPSTERKDVTPMSMDVDVKQEVDDTPTTALYHQEKQIDDIDAAFEYDAIPTLKMSQLKGNLIKMRVITTKQDRPNCIMIANGDNMYYVNGSGIFDKDHNSYYIAGRNETLAISKLIQHKEKAIINDFFSIFESFD